MHCKRLTAPHKKAAPAGEQFCGMKILILLPMAGSRIPDRLSSANLRYQLYLMSVLGMNTKNRPNYQQVVPGQAWLSGFWWIRQLHMTGNIPEACLAQQASNFAISHFNLPRFKVKPSRRSCSCCQISHGFQQLGPLNSTCSAEERCVSRAQDGYKVFCASCHSRRAQKHSITTWGQQKYVGIMEKTMETTI